VVDADAWQFCSKTKLYYFIFLIPSLYKNRFCAQGRRQKNFQEGGPTKKKQTKNSKKDQKIALLCFFRGGSNGKKTEKLQKRPKIIALFSRYLLNLYRV